MVDIAKNFDMNPILEQKHPIGLTPEQQKYILENVVPYVQNPVKKNFYCKF